MPEAVVTAHIPLIRIEPEQVVLPFGELVRLPFEAFDAISHHLFADWRERYEATAPIEDWLLQRERPAESYATVPQ